MVPVGSDREIIMMSGSKGLLPPTDAANCSVAYATYAILNRAIALLVSGH